MIAGLIQARIGSQRCPNKMLRDFGDTNLISLALKKFAGTSSKFKLYFAAYDRELLDLGRKFDCTLIERNEESASADNIKLVFNYLSEIKEDYVMFINACSPFLTLQTLESAINIFETESPKSLTAVEKSHTWYYFLDGKPINFLDPTNLNTKTTEPLLQVTHNIHIFNKERFIKHTYFWNHTKNDPYFFEVNDLEAIDIDTELDFKRASLLYTDMNK